MTDVVRFADCAVDLGRFEIRRAGERVHVEPQVFDVLAYLIRHRDRSVPKGELLDEVWGDRFVSESALTSRLKAARAGGRRRRRAAAGHPHRARPRLPFVADGGRARTEPAPALPTVDGGRPTETRRLEPADPVLHRGRRHPHRLRDDRAGPPLVKAANWMTHLDYDWESPVWRHWLEGLAQRPAR